MFPFILRSTHEAAIQQQPRLFAGHMVRIGHPAVRDAVATFLDKQTPDRLFSFDSLIRVIHAAVERVEGGIRKEVRDESREQSSILAARVGTLTAELEKAKSDGQEMADLWKQAVKDQVALAPLVKIGRARQAALQAAKDKKATAKS